MERELTKEQQAVLTRAHMKGGTCFSSTAYEALAGLGRTRKESNEDSILENIVGTLQSLVELGLMEKIAPGKYQLAKEGNRIAESLAKSPFA